MPCSTSCWGAPAGRIRGIVFPKSAKKPRRRIRLPLLWHLRAAAQALGLKLLEKPLTKKSRV